MMKKSKFSDEQIVTVLQEAATGVMTQSDVCRKHGISENTFYIWKRRFAGMTTEDVRRLKELERENGQLKRLLAERDLEVDAMRSLFRKNGQALPSVSRERDAL
jgi:putative transposase